jgi:hypothetical protein
MSLPFPFGDQLAAHSIVFEGIALHVFSEPLHYSRLLDHQEARDVPLWVGAED